MIAAARPLRRRARLLLLQTAHVCRRHYGSFVSLAVLSVALTFALTSSSFSPGSPEDGAPPPAARIELPDGYKLAWPAAEPRVTFYLYEDEADRKLYIDILRSDYTAMSRMGLPNYIGEVHFLRVASEAEREYASLLISEMTSYTGAQGNAINLNVVDLR